VSLSPYLYFHPDWPYLIVSEAFTYTVENMRSQLRSRLGRYSLGLVPLLVLVGCGVGVGVEPAGAVVVAHANASGSSWGGYVADWTGYQGVGTYNSASTTFVVPAVSSCGAHEYSAASIWAGLDGIGGSRGLEQTGVTVSCNAGFISYSAWWEMLPSSSGIFATMTIHAGDTIVASVSGASRPNYVVSVRDITQNQTQSANVVGTAGFNQSAECVVEDPRGNGTQLPYVHYSVINFSACSSNGHALGVYAPTPIDSWNGAGPQINTSLMGANGSFSVTRLPDGSRATGTGPLSGRAVGMAAMPNGLGYWIVNARGQLSAQGYAQSYGDLGNLTLNKPISHIVSTSDGKGYWMVAADGGTFAFGDAGFYGSMGASHLNAPVVSMAPTADNRGYWLVASDGGIFAFGDARFLGSMGGTHLNKPVDGIASDSATGGYWMVASDGGIFAFGAPFWGSAGADGLTSPVLCMTATAGGGGYFILEGNNQLFAYGDAVNRGVPGANYLNLPLVDMAADKATGGYWLLDGTGTVWPYLAPLW
jgi:hypothetical protein